jgi:hypothetical protein
MSEPARWEFRLLVVVAVTASLAAGVPASAGQGAPVVGVRVERMLTAMVTVRLGGAASVGEAGGFERQVDQSGRVLSETPIVPNGGAALTPVGEFGCVASGAAPGFTDHSTHAGPARLESDLDGGGARSVFHVYTLEGARRVGDRRTVQVLVCLAGGARPADGWRLLQAGVGAAYDSKDETFMLGGRSLDGPTPPIAEDGYGFGSTADVGAAGRIVQQPRGGVEGSLVGPFETGLNDYFRNALAGWWEDPCLDEAAVCLPTDGSDTFQGSLAGGLWEFFADDVPADGFRFRIASFSTLSCTAPSPGCGAPGGQARTSVGR